MAARVRAHGWEATPLGPRGGWPAALHAAVDLAMAMPQAASLAVGPEFVLIYNDRAAAHYGARHPGVLGRPIREGFPAEWPPIAAHYDRAFAGEGHRVLAQPVDSDGDGVPDLYDATLTPVRGDGGRVIAVLGVFDSAADRLRAQAALRQSEARYRAFVTASADVVYRMSADWSDVMAVEGQGYRLARPMPSAAWMDGHMLPEDRPEVDAAIARAIAAQAPFELEHRVRRADGTLGWTLSRAVPVVDAAGRTVEWIGAARDVTAARRETARQRAAAHRQAFLLRLVDVLRPMTDPRAIRAQAMQALRQHLGVARALHAERDASGAFVAVTAEGTEGPVGADPCARLDGGRVLRLRGAAVARAGPALAGMAAAVISPQVQDGRCTGAILLGAADRRAFTAADAALVAETGERLRFVLERVRAAAALRESEERLRSFGEASSDVLWIRDAATLAWTYLTPAFETIYGLSRAEALAGDTFANWLDLILPEDRDRAARDIGRVRAGERVTFEYRIRRPVDGELRWLRNTDFPIRGPDGRAAQIGGVGHDVTAMKRAEAAIARSEAAARLAAARLTSLIEGIPQLVWRADVGGEWTWASPQWTAFTGQAEPDSRGRGWLAAVHPDDRDAARAAWAQAAATGAFEAEYRLRRAATGGWRWFQTRAAPTRSEEGEVIEWLGTSTDVQNLREMQDRQGVLVAELQHRTRNLLAVVRGMMDKTRREAPDPAAFVAAFDDRLRALGRVQGLLSRLGTDDRIAFDDLLRAELAALGAVDAAGHGPQVALDGPAGVRLSSGTVQTFALALHELATNAVKYGALAQPTGRLRVVWDLARDAHGQLRLRVDWQESGVAMGERGAAPRGGGYGRELIERALPYQLGAETTYALGADGVRCTLSLPVSSTMEDGDGGRG